MPTSRLIAHARIGVRALCAASLASLILASAAFAASPPTVTVRVEGLSETKLPPTQVTAGGAPVVKDGNPEHACGAETAIGALQAATGGSWSGPWNSGFKQYEIFSIEGETHEFEAKSKANYFWSFWLNEKEASVGACEAAVKAGDRVLFFPSCFGEECPKPEPLPLGVEAPPTANVGEPVVVSVKRFAASGSGSEVAGAAVVGGGAGASTDGHGRASLTFTHAGQTTLQATAPSSIRAETTVCVHNGSDGTCGTTLPAATPVVVPTTPPPAPKPVFEGDVAHVAGVLGYHVYAHRRGPRLLEGRVEIRTGGTLRQVRISLQRVHGGRCYVLSGSTASFVRFHRCGRARFFSVGSAESFSYLLPAPLTRGLYVYEVQAVEASGALTRIVPGVSRVGFVVR